MAADPKQEATEQPEVQPKQAEEKKEEAQDKDKKDIEEGNWLALESNPGPLNKFAARMGLPSDFAFCDIYGLDPELLQFVPQPVLAVVLLFPSSKGIKEYKMKQQEELTKNPQKLNKDLFYLYQHDKLHLIYIRKIATYPPYSISCC